MSKPPRLTLPSVARAYRLGTARGEFAVHEAGEPLRGTALLVPGFTGSKEDFIGLLEPLAAAGYRVVAVDGRGQYESPGPRDESAYGCEELARDLLAQARALDAGPVHLVGHSLGGLICRAAVLRDPAPFASLTLMSSGPAAITENQQARTKLLIAALETLRDDMAAVWDAMRAQDPPNAVPDPRAGGLPARAVAGDGTGAADRHGAGADLGARPGGGAGAGAAAQAGPVGGGRLRLAGAADGRDGAALEGGASHRRGRGTLPQRREPAGHRGCAGRLLGYGSGTGPRGSLASEKISLA